MKKSVKLPQLLEAIKIAYITIAQEELTKQKIKISDSKLSVMTGVHRKDVARLTRHKIKINNKMNLIEKIIGLWQQGERYNTKSKKPKILSVKGKNSEFFHLVKSVSEDIDPYTVLFELKRLKVIEKTKNGIQLIGKAYIPLGEEIEGYKIISRDINDLITAVEQNIEQISKHCPDEEKINLHLRTEYDNVDPSKISIIKKWILKEGEVFHKRIRNFISKFDRDIYTENKECKSKLSAIQQRARVAVGSFSFIEQDYKEIITNITNSK